MTTFHEFRSKAPLYISGVTRLNWDCEAVLRNILDGIFYIHKAEENGAEAITEIRDLRMCIDKRLETFKLPVKETKANLRLLSIIEIYKMTKNVNIVLKEFFNANPYFESKIEETKKKREDPQWPISQILLSAVWKTDEIKHSNCTIEHLWNGILILIDAENEGIEEFSEIIKLRNSINKRLEHLKNLDCFIETPYKYYVQYYIKGYLMTQKLNITLTEFFNVAEDEKEKTHKEVQRKEINKKLNEYLNKLEMDEILYESDSEEELQMDKCLSDSDEELGMDECLNEEEELVTAVEAFTPVLDIISTSPGVATFNFIEPVLEGPRRNVPAGAKVIVSGGALPGGNLFVRENVPHSSCWPIKRRSCTILNRETWADFSKLTSTRKYSTISSEKNSFPKVASMAKSTQTPCMLLAVDKTAVFTFGGDDVRKPVTVNRNVCSFLWRSCVDIFNLSFAYRMRRIPSHFIRRSFIQLIMQRKQGQISS